MATELVNSLESKRQREFASAKSILELADNENRAMTSDEEKQFDAHHAEGERITGEIKRRMAQEAADATLREMAAPVRTPGVSTDRETRSVEQVIRQDEDNFASWLNRGVLADGSPPASETLDSVGGTTVLRNIFASAEARRNALERRTMITVTDAYQAGDAANVAAAEAAGGYLTSETMAAAVEIALLAYNGFMAAPTRKLSTSNGEPIQWPMVNDTANKGKRIAQNEAAVEQTITLQNKTVNAWTYSSNMVEIARQLLQDSRYGAAELIGELLGVRLGRIQEEETTTGGGATSGPESVIDFLEGLAANAGRGATVANNADVDWESIIDLEMSIDAAYRAMPATGFMFNSNTLGVVKKLKDNQDRPLWLPGNVAGGNPATLFGYPYWLNEHMASHGTVNNSFMLFGDMSKVILRTSLDMFIMRLDERYAERFIVAFLGWMRYDSRVLDAGTHPLKLFRDT